MSIAGHANVSAAQDVGIASPVEPDIADVLSEPSGFVTEPDFIRRAVVIQDRMFTGTNSTEGLYTAFGDMTPGAGWISVGPGYRRWYSRDRLFVDASAAVSWRGYKTAQSRIELPRLFGGKLLAGSQARWQDYAQVNFFGEGQHSREADRSQYRIRTGGVGAYVVARPLEWLSIGAKWDTFKPTISSAAGFFKPNVPSTEEALRGDVVYSTPDQPTFRHRELSLTVDTRDFRGHPTEGALYRLALEHFADDGARLFTFTRYEAEAARFASVAESRLVLALHGWLVASDPRDGQSIPFYLQPSLGGHNSLRSYADYRFHDRHLLLVNAEVRVPMMTHVDAAAFLDAGDVAPSLGELGFGKRSYGVGVRLHSRRQTFARLDLAHGSEGWRLVARLTEPLDLSRLTRRTASVPFAP